MSKEITDIFENIHEYFSRYNEFVCSKAGDSALQIVEAINMINNNKYRIIAENCEFVIDERDKNGEKILRIVLPNIDVPEVKIALCEKSIKLESEKIDEICNKIKNAFNLRYCEDDENLTYYSTDDEQWTRFEKNPVKIAKEAGKAVDKTVKEAGAIIQKSCNVVKEEVVGISDGLTNTIKSTIEKSPVKIQSPIKIQSEDFNKKLQEAYDLMSEKAEIYKKQMEDLGEKLKSANIQLSKNKKVIKDVESNIVSVVQSVLEDIKWPMPCLLVRKNTINVGIEVRYPESYDYIVKKIVMIAEKATMAEILKSILNDMLSVVTEVKVSMKNVLDKAINAAVEAFNKALHEMLQLINNSSINEDYIKCKGINDSSQGEWIELKSQLSREVFN